MISNNLVKIYADGHEYLCPVEEIYQPERKDVQMSQKIDVRDEEGHLLFVYDAGADVIEIKSRKRIVRVDVMALRFRVKRSVLQSEPEGSVTVSSVEDVTSAKQPAENGSGTPHDAPESKLQDDSPSLSIDTEKEKA